MNPVSPSPYLPVPPSFASAPAVQVKICGITTPEDAEMSVRAGAAAIGLVFHPPSPRHLTLDRAAAIAGAVPPGFPLVGVFVDAGETEIRQQVERLGLTAVQLHGRENPTLVADLRRTGLFVIKALFINRQPDFMAVSRYLASAFLIEAGRGLLAGGTGQPWPWAIPGEFYRGTPLILAGGLQADNVRDAIQSVRPDAVDVSSGVESAPGRKDPDRVRAFLEAARACPASPAQSIRRRIF